MEHIELSDIQGDRSIENQKISLLSSLSLSADSVKSAINKVIDSDNQKLPLSGGVLSGDIGTSGSISCVSYLQTDATGYMQNYCSRGGHLETAKGKYTDFRPLGVSFYKPSKVGGCVGAMGYCMLSGCNDPETGNGVLKLSGDAAPLKEAVRQLSAKTDQFKWSISLDSGSDCYAYNVDPEKIEDVYADDGKTISATIVGLKQPIAASTVKLFKSTEAEMLALWENQVENEDDNCFYCPTVPEAGNQLVPVFYGAHAEGCMSRAIQRATHAEGRSCLADGRYSHAEGMNTIAANAATHSEG
jgi:hypothetical protein